MTSPETDPAIPEVSPEPFPQEPISQEPAASTGIPWEDLGLSRPVALGRTLRAVLWRPGEFFRAVPGGDWREALAFGLLLGTTGFAASLFWNLLTHLWAGRPMGLFALPQVRSLGHGAIIILMAVSPAVVLANLGLSSLCLWGAVSSLGVILSCGLMTTYDMLFSERRKACGNPRNCQKALWRVWQWG
jgi:hypothetical protein